MIHRFLTRRIDPGDADGLVGEVFRIAFERRSSFDLDRPSARPWLYGIATNVLAHHRRSEVRRFHAMARLASVRIPDHADLFGERVSASIDADRAWPRFVAAIDDLPAEERHTLLLYAWEELSYADIAAALDVPVGTVRSRLNRARQRLRSLRDEFDTKDTSR